MKTRIGTLILVALTVTLYCGRAAAPVAAASPTDTQSKHHLNVLFIVSDDLRPELGCYGNSIIKTPNIDNLAKHGMVFERAYCQQAVCSPSRSSVMTGARPDTTKVWDLKTHFRKAPPDVVTLPQHFNENGYATHGIGKIYHSGLDDPPSWTIKTARRRRSSTAKKRSARKESKPPSEAVVNVTKTDRGPAFSATDDAPNGGGDGDVADQAIAALRKFKSGSKPFFLGVEFVDIYPTLASLAGLSLPTHLEGTSLKPLLDDSQLQWKAAAFSQYPRTFQGRKLVGYSMRTDRYRFTRWVHRDDHTKVDAVELYDHMTDPEENSNIANDSANVELVAKLTRQSIAGWKRQHIRHDSE
jgi:arylsulfatase A-like enzyme